MARIAVVFCLLLAVVVAAPNKKMPSAMAGRIIGGTNADISKMPYQVSIRVKGEHDCGGSIIGPKFILTAAHCVLGTEADYTVKAGSSEYATGGFTKNVQKISRHPDYNDFTLDNDIAVLELVTPFKYSDKVKKIELADKAPTEGDEVSIAGWGKTTEKSRVRSKKLQSVTLKVTNKENCKKIYHDKSVPVKQVFCAGVMSGGKDACSGDSGGPAIVNGKQAGVISWGGEGCGRKNSPGVFTNVVEYIPWILSQTR